MKRTDDSGLPLWLARELERTARDEPEKAKRAMAKALAAVTEGNDTVARAQLLKVRELAPRSPVMREALGLLYYRAGEWHPAAQELLAFRRFSGKHDQDPKVAECYRKLGRPQRSLDLLKETPLDQVKEQVRIEAEIAKARAYEDLGRPEVAKASLERAARDTTSARARAYYTKALQKFKD